MSEETITTGDITAESLAADEEARRVRRAGANAQARAVLAEQTRNIAPVAPRMTAPPMPPSAAENEAKLIGMVPSLKPPAPLPPVDVEAVAAMAEQARRQQAAMAAAEANRPLTLEERVTRLEARMDWILRRQRRKVMTSDELKRQCAMRVTAILRGPRASEEAVMVHLIVNEMMRVHADALSEAREEWAGRCKRVERKLREMGASRL